MEPIVERECAGPADSGGAPAPSPLEGIQRLLVKELKTVPLGQPLVVSIKRCAVSKLSVEQSLLGRDLPRQKNQKPDNSEKEESSSQRSGPLRENHASIPYFSSL